MYQKMAIMAKPHEIFELVVPSISITMMHREHSNIVCATQPANTRNMIAIQDTPVRG